MKKVLRTILTVGMILFGSMQTGCKLYRSDTMPGLNNISKMTEEEKAQKAAATAEFWKTAKPYRTWISIESYKVDNDGHPAPNGISSVRLQLNFPNGEQFELPGKGEYWLVGDGKTQEIKAVYELPYAYVGPNDGFDFVIQMDKKRGWLKPCQFNVSELSQFNRKYICKTDLEWQRKKGTAEDSLDQQAIEVRVLTDLNTPSREMPTNSVALKNLPIVNATSGGAQLR